MGLGVLLILVVIVGREEGVATGFSVAVVVAAVGLLLLMLLLLGVIVGTATIMGGLGVVVVGFGVLERGGVGFGVGS